ncbi:MAG TPA: orotidine-5'-phosphate decarboxylase [Limnochordia bacterium]|nr:orotidine-5'-phosphate decarboxylase [Limnochordia bacterium]
MSFGERLAALIRARRSAVCVGIDPRPDRIPAELWPQGLVQPERPEAIEQALVAFGEALVAAAAGAAVAVKPQLAFFERHGWRGLRAFSRIAAAARDAGLIVLADAKRGDIGSTAEAYAAAFFTRNADFAADAVTINPYLGGDAIAPFAAYAPEKGLFILAKTSNLSSGELQDRRVRGRPLYEWVVRLAQSWCDERTGSLGLVVGATYPRELARVRALAPGAWILVPGYGAQGGGAADAAPAFRADGGGALVSASRSIAEAYVRTGEPLQDAARREIEQMRAALWAVGGGRS